MRFVARRRQRLWLGVLAGLALYYQGAGIQLHGAEAASDKLPDAVVLRLRSNASALSTALLECKETDSGHVAKTYRGAIRYTIYLDGRKFRQRREAPQFTGEAVEQAIGEVAFDGTTVFFGFPATGSNPPAILQKFAPRDDADPDRLRSIYPCPYLEGAGYYIPQSVAEFSKGQPDSLVLHCLSESRTTHVETSGKSVAVEMQIPDREVLQARSRSLVEEEKVYKSGHNSPEWVARELAALRTLQERSPWRRVRFVLDAEHEYRLVSRTEFFGSGEQAIDARAEEWEQPQHVDLWLPKKCVISSFRGGAPWMTATLDLMEADFRPQADVSFTLDYQTPGTFVSDRTTTEARNSVDHRVTYHVPATEDELRRRAEEALAQGGGHGYWTLGAIALNVVLLVILGGYVWIRRQRLSR